MSPTREPHIVSQGDDYVIVSKPTGLATTGRTLDDPECLQSELMQHLSRRKVWAVHQLDKGTSGLCVFALKKPSVARWAARLRAGRKLYLGVVDGVLEGRHEVRAPIARVTLSDGRTQPAIHPQGKGAHSTIEALETIEGRTLVVGRIHTGRTHQVRLHLSHLGVPLVGERMHREPPCHALPYPALHSWILQVEDDEGSSLTFEAPLPDALAQTLSGWGFTLPSPYAVGI